MILSITEANLEAKTLVINLYMEPIREIGRNSQEIEGSQL